MADFDGNGILVPVIAGRGFFMQRNTLDDLAFQSDHKVGADIRRWACIIVPILLGGGTGVAEYQVSIRIAVGQAGDCH